MVFHFFFSSFGSSFGVGTAMSSGAGDFSLILPFRIGLVYVLGTGSLLTGTFLITGATRGAVGMCSPCYIGRRLLHLTDQFIQLSQVL